MKNYIQYDPADGRILVFGQCDNYAFSLMEYAVEGIPAPGDNFVDLVTMAPKKVDLPPAELPYDQKRALDYMANNITTDAMVVALWELVVENRREAADAIQALRVAIKAKYPKPA